MDWIVYIIQCSDGSLYTGITNNLAKRIDTHNTDDMRGSRYVRSRRPVTVVFSQQVTTRSEALKREAAIKKLSRMKKLLLISESTYA